MGCCGNKTDAVMSDLEMRERGDQTDGGKWGNSKKYDPNFNGPIKKRSCTDIPCCILFLLCIVAMVIVGILAFMWGNPDRLLHPVNSEGKTCGTGDYKDKPKLLFFDLTECIPSPSIKAATSFAGFDYVCPTTQVCVKECPNENSFGVDVNCTKMACKTTSFPFNPCSLSEAEKEEFVKNGTCAPYYVESQDILSRCIPTVLGSTLSNIIDKQGNTIQSHGKNLTGENLKDGSIVVQTLIDLQNIGMRVLEDVSSSWWLLLAAFGIAMAGSFLYIIIMRWVAGIMVWLTTYAVLTLIGFGVYYCYTKYKELDDKGDDKAFEFTTDLSVYKDSKKTWLAFTIILGVVLLILVLLLLALRKRIQIAVALIKEGSRAISSMMFTLFWPVIPWLLQLLVFAWFVAVGVHLATTGDAEFQLKRNETAVIDSLCKYEEYVDSKNETCVFVKFADNLNIFRLQVFHLFGWFWLLNFVIALGQCVLAGAFASYYWAWDKKTDIPAFPVFASFLRTLRYHIGSLAFGALIIAIVQIIRATLEYIEHKLKSSAENNKIIRYVLKCLKCCFWCLEKFLKFLNKNAYIEIAVYGKNFCVSAKNAFMLLMRNVVRVVVLDKVTDFLLFIGKLTITIAMAIGSFYWFERDENLNYFLAPVIIITVATYVIATAFFSVYEMAIDTLFLCFLEDLERNDGSEEKPYYMSKKLKKILGKKNKKASDSD